MNQAKNNINSPWMSLVILLGLTVVSSIGISMLVLLVEVFFRSNVSTVMQNTEEALGINFTTNPIYSYASVIAGSIGTFLLPALLLQKIESYNNYFPSKRQRVGLFMVLALLFLVAFSPVMELIGDMNMKMSLPESMKSIEAWMRVQEDNMAELTKNMVMVDSWGRLLINLFAVAVLPAIAEECYFRGAVMNISQRITKNAHLSIWITAIIFSAIHVQFFGFFPRMLLGAIFGYMLLWSKNIWVPMLAHFVNNGFVVVLAFYYTRQGKTFEDLQTSEGYTIIVYLAGLILSGVIVGYFYKKSKEIIEINGKGLD